MSSSAISHAASRRAINHHFAGRASPRSESAMRAHLLDCSPCRQFYDRHLLLASLDPRALSPQQRLEVGLDFSRPRRDRTWITVLSFSVAAVAVLLLFPRGLPWGGLRTDGPQSGLTARGEARRGTINMRGELWTYRVQGAASPQLVHDSLGADDELAFAYANPAGKSHVMVFGVDEHRHIFWFHPAWAPGQPPPVAVAAVAGPGPHELQGAIHHDFDGNQLAVYAVFSDRALDVLTVERHVQSSTVDEGWTLAAPGIESVRQVFQVRPR